MKELEDYRNHMLNHHEYKFESSLNNIIRDIREFLSIMEIETLNQLKQLKKTDLDTYLSKIRDIGNSINTRKTKMARVRMFFNYLFEYDYIEKNITHKVKVICKKKTDKNLFSHSDAVKVLNEAQSKEEYAILSTFLGTGIRVGELITLRIKDIQDERIYVFGGKGDKDRWVYCIKKITDTLKEYIEDTKDIRGSSDYVFFSKKNKNTHTSVGNVYNIIKRCAKKSKISNWEQFSAHKFRHIYAMYALNVLNISIDEVSKNLGHSDIAVTSRSYVEASEENVRNSFTNVKEKGILGRKTFDFSEGEED